MQDEGGDLSILEMQAADNGVQRRFGGTIGSDWNWNVFHSRDCRTNCRDTNKHGYGGLQQ